MKEKTVRELLLDYLHGVGKEVAGGVLEDYVRAKVGSKASCASRRLRELENDGLIIKDYRQVNGKGVHFVVYRIARRTLF